MIQNLLLTIAAASAMAAPAAPAIKRAVSIESTSVLSDVQALTGKSIFDIVPTADTSADYCSSMAFRFIAAYNHSGDVYFYFVYNDASNFDVKYAKVTYSTSTTLASNGTPVETVTSGFASVASTYQSGTLHWAKAKWAGFYEFSEGAKHRIQMETVTLADSSQTVSNTLSWDVTDEYSWEDTSASEDRVSSYYHDNYVVVSSKKVAVQCVDYIDSTSSSYYHGEGSTSENNIKNAAHELSWAFFKLGDSSRPLTKLKSADVTYGLYEYEVNWRQTGMVNDKCFIYDGAYPNIENPDAAEDFRKSHPDTTAIYEVDYSNYHLLSQVAATVDASSSTITETTGNDYFFLWQYGHEKINYTYSHLQALDDASVAAIGDASFKSFIDSEKAGYDYAILADSSTRYTDSAWASFNNPNDFFKSVYGVHSVCHQADEVQILRLCFYDTVGTFSLSALDNATDTTTASNIEPTETHVSDIPFFGNVYNDWDEIVEGLKIAGICLAAAAAIVGGVWAFSLIKGAVGSAAKAGKRKG